MSWREGRAQERWEQINNGDDWTFHYTEFSEIDSDVFEKIEGDWSDQDVENLIVNEFEKLGYVWKEDVLDGFERYFLFKES
jgi:hypothetical protein